MPPLPIVEKLEVLEALGVRLLPSGPDGVVDQLDIQRRENAFGAPLVPAIARAAHAPDVPVIGKGWRAGVVTRNRRRRRTANRIRRATRLRLTRQPRSTSSA